MKTTKLNYISAKIKGAETKSIGFTKIGEALEIDVKGIVIEIYVDNVRKEPTTADCLITQKIKLYD